MFVVVCPHCHLFVWIEEVNCAIFRHGVFRDTHAQVPPHASKAECDDLVARDLIIGCGKPFRVVNSINGTDSPSAIPCDYI
jgi:hypothetical protein